MRTACTAMRGILDEDRAPAVHRDDLSGDVRGAGEEVYRLGNVFRAANPAERRSLDDATALRGFELPVLGPGDGARSNAVHPHLRRELDGEGARHGGKAGLGDAVDRIAFERTIGVDVDDVDD